MYMLNVQTHKDWRFILIDDNSDDGTYNIAMRYISDNMSDKYAAGDIKVIRTDRRRYALYNEFIGLHSFNPKPADEDVMVIIDGDDWLYDDGVLAYVSSIYDNNPNVWITYGTHYDFRCCV